MKNVYILHGCCDREEFEDTSIPSGSNFHWIPWLQKQLIVKGYNCQTPEMPTPYKPNYRVWKEIFENYPLDADTTLVAHSCGCGFILRYLSENPQPLKNIVLVAPWLDPHEKMGSFLKFDLNSKLSKITDKIHVFYSKDEPVEGVKQSVDKLKQSLSNIYYHEFENHGHFCLGEMGTDAFPELLEVVAK
jgi:predicted alpha/beta hydrolase family esterase